MPKNSKLGLIKFPIDTHRQLGSKISFQAIEVKPPEVDIKLEKSETHKDINKSGPTNRATAIGQTAVDLLPVRCSKFFKGDW